MARLGRKMSDRSNLLANKILKYFLVNDTDRPVMVVEILFGIRLDLLGHLRFPETSITIKMSKARDFTDLRDIVLYFSISGPRSGEV